MAHVLVRVAQSSPTPQSSLHSLLAARISTPRRGLNERRGPRIGPRLIGLYVVGLPSGLAAGIVTALVSGSVIGQKRSKSELTRSFVSVSRSAGVPSFK